MVCSCEIVRMNGYKLVLDLFSDEATVCSDARLGFGDCLSNVNKMHHYVTDESTHTIGNNDVLDILSFFDLTFM